MSNKNTVLLMPGNGIPSLAEPEDMDQWPSEAAAQAMLTAIKHIVDAGFQGVRLLPSQSSNGKFLINFATNSATPEGRIADGLSEFAKAGVVVDLDTVISTLERIYREQGLELPYGKEAA